MSKKQWYGLRLALALLAVSFTLACTSLLDLDSLKSKPKPDGLDAAVDGPVGTDQKAERRPDMRPPDKPPAVCTPSAACAVAGKFGLCATGSMQCTPAPPVCKQTVQPAAEACNGQDQDCDNTGDASDLQAHLACGEGKYCTGSSCAAGCGANAQCNAAGATTANTCNTSHKCVCGTGDACTAPLVCTGTTTKQCCPATGCTTKPDLGPDRAITPDLKPDTKPAPDTKAWPDTKPEPDTVAWPDQNR